MTSYFINSKKWTPLELIEALRSEVKVIQDISREIDDAYESKDSEALKTACAKAYREGGLHARVSRGLDVLEALLKEAK